VAPNANPPVCRIMDYGKYRYEASQRAKESRRKASHTTLKEMKYRPKIGTGDFATKTKKVEKFLDQGHKVKVTIMFRGREVFHPERGMEILDRVAEAVDHVGKVDQAARLDGRNMTMVLSPDRRAQQQRHDRAERSAGAEAGVDGRAGADVGVDGTAGANGDTTT
jgi:translation initiation factor IF-3